MNFDAMLSQKTQETEEIILSFLPKEEGNQKTVLEAMNYSVKVGGKRLRPLLMAETYRMFGGDGEIIKSFMAALEMIHTYSLVHDDLEAMDNDEYRRGMKTTHVVYGEAMAILAGDALLNYAFEIAASAFERNPGDVRAERAMMVLARKAGIFGMVGGQVCDVEAEKRQLPLSKDQLLFIHENKTAALIQSALMIGAILAGAEQTYINALEKIGYNIGIAFQIQDDILDITGSEQELGKPVGSDVKNNKETYVTLAGLEASARQVEALSKEAVQLLGQLPGEHAFLDELILSLIHRTK
ncbi:MAG: polyprenyl synthetase family protein [Lachnospiraceae bacterium]|nr:polyprenyl synthetase family protein [Lachnospiraceae bacterium]